MQNNSRWNLSLALGILLGLALGLIVGWGLWPVDWGAAAPQDLNAQAKQAYVQVIAEAHFATGDLPTAQARLQELVGPEDDPQALVQGALAALGDSPGTARSSMIYLSDALLRNPTLTPAPTGSPPQAAAAPPPPAESVDASTLSQLRGPLALILLAAVFIVGGLYIAYRWVWSASKGENAFGQARPAPSNPARIPADAVGPRLRPNEPDPNSRFFSPEGAGNDPGYIFNQGYQGSNRRPAQTIIEGDAYYPPGPVTDFDEDSLQEGSNIAPISPEPPPLNGGREAAVSSRSPMGRLAEWVFRLFSRGEDSRGEGSRGEGSSAEARPSSAHVRFTPDEEGYFEADFYAGSESEASKSFNRPGGGYAGECGMAVSKLNTGPSDSMATALEVWLFEKSHISTRTQHLLSPHLFRAGEWDQKNLGKLDPPPLEARQGLVFELRGEETTLHCQISEVEFLASGPPQSAFKHLHLKMVPTAR